MVIKSGLMQNLVETLISVEFPSGKTLNLDSVVVYLIPLKSEKQEMKHWNIKVKK